MNILAKNFLTKIILAFIVILSFSSPYLKTIAAKESYSNLFIKITDANTALTNNDKDKAKKLIDEFKTEFESTKNSDSEAGKKVKQTLKSNDINEDQLRELSTALLAFENEQNPLDVEAEKKAFKTKLFPAFDKLEKAIDTKNVETMRAEYVKYNAAWVRNEGIVRTLEPAYYGKVETTMSFLRSSMEAEPYDYQTTKMYLTDLKNYLDDFLAGKKLEQSSDIKTLEQGIKLLEESYSAFKDGNKAQGSQKMKKFIEVWPVIEGEVEKLFYNNFLDTKIILGFGCINPRSDRVETVDEIVRNVEKVLEFLPPENVWLNPDCGFATFSKRPLNPFPIIQKKLENMVEASKILREKYCK